MAVNHFKKLASQTAIYGLSSVVPRLLNYILVPLYTRVFLPEEYGVVTELYAYLAVLLVLLTYGMETGYFRFATKEDNSSTTYSTAFFSLLTSSTFFILLMYFLSPSIGRGLGYENNPEYIYFLAIVIGLDAFTAIPFARLRLLNKALSFSTIKILGVLLNVGLNFFFLVVAPKYPLFQEIGVYQPNLGVAYVFISNIASSVLVTIILLFIPGTIPKTFSFVKLKELFLYSIPLLISGLGGTTNESMDRIFLKHLLPADKNPLYELGIYGSNVKIAVLMVLFIQMYRYAAEPFFFSNAGKKDSPEIYANMLKYFTVFSLLIFLGVGLFTDIFQYLVGSEFREGLSVVPILLLANLFYGIFFNISIWYKLRNKTWYGIYYTFAGAALTVTLYFLLIPKIGYYGAAIARLACYIFMVYICYLGTKKYYPIPYDIKRILLYIGASIALFLIGYFVNFNIYIVSLIFRFFLVALFLMLVLLVEKIQLNQLLSILKK